MANDKNDLDLPIGALLPNWRPCEAPSRTELEGRYAKVVPLDPLVHASDLHAANLVDTEHRNWVYLAYGPFESEQDYRAWMRSTCLSPDPLFYAVTDRATGKATGLASYLRIARAVGVIEVGHINFAPSLQRTRAATEAMYLMVRHVFDDLGYRRVEWKCDALNGRSRRAALRLGFSYEGTFRQATVYKGRSRDTAWYSMLDGEWPKARAAFENWLDPTNFDSQGNQLESLGRVRADL